MPASQNEDLEDDDDFDDEEDDDNEGESKEDTTPRIERGRAVAYGKTRAQLKTFYDEMSGFSAKKPNDVINKFKLKLINETLANANFVLGDHYRPFPHFTLFDEADMPTASDVVLMLSHYLTSFTKFLSVYYDSSFGRWMILGGSKHGDEIQDLPPTN